MLIFFLLVSLISFVGSIHPGTVNMAVVQATITQSRRAGLLLALGGSVPEIGYSALAAGGLMLIPATSGWWALLAYAPIPVLLGAGIASLRQKPVVLSGAPVTAGVMSPFWQGVVLAGSNPQLLPFWSAVWLYLSSHMLVPVGRAASQWVFALGTSAGAFVLLLGVALLADRQRAQILRHLNGRRINRLTGTAFIGMAIWQAIQLRW